MEEGREIVKTVKKISAIGISPGIVTIPRRTTVLRERLKSAREVLHSALALHDPGAFYVVLEASPHILASYITSKLVISTVRIGASLGMTFI